MASAIKKPEVMHTFSLREESEDVKMMLSTCDNPHLSLSDLWRGPGLELRFPSTPSSGSVRPGFRGHSAETTASNSGPNQLQTSAEIAYQKKKKMRGREADTLCAWKQLKLSRDSSAAAWFEMPEWHSGSVKSIDLQRAAGTKIDWLYREDCFINAPLIALYTRWFPCWPRKA